LYTLSQLNGLGGTMHVTILSMPDELGGDNAFHYFRGEREI